MRESGILMHITSLPGPYGIGTMGKNAFEFVDFLKKAGQKIWQILPLSPTGYGDSPYQSCSAFAGNHYLIDLETLMEKGLLENPKRNPSSGAKTRKKPISTPFIRAERRFFALHTTALFRMRNTKNSLRKTKTGFRNMPFSPQ